MLVAVHFSIVAENPSEPVALDLSRVRRNCSTSSAANKSSRGRSSAPAGFESEEDKGG